MPLHDGDWVWLLAFLAPNLVIVSHLIFPFKYPITTLGYFYTRLSGRETLPNNSKSSPSSHNQQPAKAMAKLEEPMKSLSLNAKFLHIRPLYQTEIRRMCLQEQSKDSHQVSHWSEVGILKSEIFIL